MNPHQLMRTILFISAIYLSQITHAQEAFITTWDTDPTSIGVDDFVIPTTGSGYNYDVSWENLEDSNINGSLTGLTGSVVIDTEVAGTYRVEITEDFPRIYFNNDFTNESDARKLLTVEQWGDIAWTSFSDAFEGCESLRITASDAPDLSGVTDMTRMFAQATSIADEDFTSWDVSNITTMRNTFFRASSFNGDISTWNVSNVTDMGALFSRATAFNSDISNWDVSNVTQMAGMFARAESFNVDISSWNVSNVTDLSSTFSNATIFNADISSWNVSNVTTTASMFAEATAFTGDLSTWDVVNVTDMSRMFYSATNFNSDLSIWNVSNVTNLSYMFQQASAFNADISSWDISSTTNMEGMFFGATSFNADIGQENHMSQFLNKEIQT